MFPISFRLPESVYFTEFSGSLKRVFVFYKSYYSGNLKIKTVSLRDFSQKNRGNLMKNRRFFTNATGVVTHFSDTTKAT
ncbi:MAG: hypothetical protein IKZ88_04500 [Neisseriaceae bacterium]|nr:hypothetical protein [Neisseriaceae bacterium]